MPGTTTTDRLLRAALLLKGLDGAVELLAGVALALVGPRNLGELTRRVVAHHLLGSPHGILAERFTAGEAALGGGDRTFRRRLPDPPRPGEAGADRGTAA
ncbi:DUF2127 domain-containing protein [Geodermatophilus obscurus]|uniref:DUF2127 domain-containing protein n=1 Tax=Geodermatophilus obscurus TaxID=1861 RepID=UPI001AD8B111